jgi:hypothetical protein
MSSRVVVLGRALLATAVSITVPGASAEQQPYLLPIEPPTKLEALMSKRSALVFFGSSKVGGVRAALGAFVTVGSREVTDVLSGERALGVAVEVRDGGGRSPVRVSYVDIEEIPALLAALDSMGKVQRTETTLERFEARYLTQGGLLVSVFDVGQGMKAAVSTGLAGEGTTELGFGEFQQLRQLLQLAYDAVAPLRSR